MRFLCSFVLPKGLGGKFDKLRESVEEHRQQQVRVLDVPGKRRALVACSFISRGQLIVTEMPTGQQPSLAQQSKLNRAAPLCALSTMSLDQEEHIAPPGAGEDNGGDLQARQEVDGSSKGATGAGTLAGASSRKLLSHLEATARPIACINHSCLPNAHASWNDVQKKEVVYALKDIQQGEEISATYVPLDADTASRQRQLFRQFGFQCRCPACQATGEQLERSDRRRRKMASIDALIPALAQRKPRKAIRRVEDLVRLIDKEGILDTSLKARAYYDAFQICLSFPMVGDAKHYARLAFENYLTCRGADSPCTLRLHGYMMNPESHPASLTARQYADNVRENIENERSRDAHSPSPPKYDSAPLTTAWDPQPPPTPRQAFERWRKASRGGRTPRDADSSLSQTRTPAPVSSPFTLLRQQPWPESATAAGDVPPPDGLLPAASKATGAGLGSSLLDQPQQTIAQGNMQCDESDLERQTSDFASEFRSCYSGDVLATGGSLGSGTWGGGAAQEEILTTGESWRALFSDPHKPGPAKRRSSSRLAPVSEPTDGVPAAESPSAQGPPVVSPKQLPPYLAVDLMGSTGPHSSATSAQTPRTRALRSAANRNKQEESALDKWLAANLATSPASASPGMAGSTASRGTRSRVSRNSRGNPHVAKGEQPAADAVAIGLGSGEQEKQELSLREGLQQRNREKSREAAQLQDSSGLNKSPTAAMHEPPPEAGKKKPSFFGVFGRTRISNHGDGPHTGSPVISVEIPPLLRPRILREEVSQAAKSQGKRLKQGARASVNFLKDFVAA